MSTKHKIAAAVVAAVVVGTMLVGTAAAAPQAPARGAPYGYGMMGTPTQPGAGYDAPTWSEMRSFMDRYRNADGTIDVDRMHGDIAAGRAAAPCGGGTVTGPSGGTAPSSLRRGRAMMQATATGAASGASMMGATF